MRIAVLADIHGNLRALEAVAADVRRRAPDVTVNLGDHVSGPLQAAATADWLMARRWVEIRGNHDRQLLDRPPERMGPSDRAAWAQLNDRHKAWLAGLTPTRLLDNVLLCHGSPSDDLQYLLEDGTQLASAAAIEERLGAVEARLVLCGHSHLPRVVRLADGRQIVNPGSVGLPAYDDAGLYFETGTPHARYAVVDWERGSLRVELVAVEYDWDAAARNAARADRPDWACALATGYARRP
jgi:putative phosphoesterase